MKGEEVEDAFFLDAGVDGCELSGKFVLKVVTKAIADDKECAGGADGASEGDDKSSVYEPEDRACEDR